MRAGPLPPVRLAFASGASNPGNQSGSIHWPLLELRQIFDSYEKSINSRKTTGACFSLFERSHQRFFLFALCNLVGVHRSLEIWIILSQYQRQSTASLGATNSRCRNRVLGTSILVLEVLLQVYLNYRCSIC